MKIKKVDLTAEVEALLIHFSNLWEKEDSCFGYRANSHEDLENEIIYLAYEGKEVIAYLFGHYELTEKNSVAVPQNSKCFEVEELYVLPEQRSKGIGTELFRFLEKDIEKDTDFITLSTATKNHRAILHFYIDELDMSFWSARLFKKLK